MKYPNGKRLNTSHNTIQAKMGNVFSNRGMTLEEDINATNKFYLESNKAIIHKKPTPVQIVKVNYPKRSAAVITEAYFKQASTTDYNGVYKNKHIDFEAKETRNKTLFPLANIHEHQMEHMKSVTDHGGICFLLIRFSMYHETYLLEAEKLFYYWREMLAGGKKSIPYSVIAKEGYLIPFHYQARIDYLATIDKLYF
ncbi:Holliday junction resolvase RecU [Virgibacillus sp. SK37]|uniref:Holliday junction resolvase RecU n=1 Tax=Virgibacillus sp. SK37 TaxID=403957 RepID=UPI0004D1F877|nr:Holliday junction resolvase RecU [Virgibacillus sp. SK37]AIF43600.1 recombinase RecU [Virgibacillus sp. SK37]